MNRSYLFFTFFVLGFSGLYFWLKNERTEHVEIRNIEIFYRLEFNGQRLDSMMCLVKILNEKDSFSAQLTRVFEAKTFSRQISERQLLELTKLCEEQIELKPQDSLIADISMLKIDGENNFYKIREESAFEDYFNALFRLQTE